MSDNKILVAVDFSDVCEKVLACAANQIKCSGAVPVVVYAVASYIQYATDAIPHDFLHKLMLEQAANAETKMKELLPKYFPDQNVAHHILEGAPSDVILQIARDEKVDMIVMGSHGHNGLEEIIMGSVAIKVIRRSPVPVLVVKPCSSK